MIAIAYLRKGTMEILIDSDGEEELSRGLCSLPIEFRAQKYERNNENLKFFEKYLTLAISDAEEDRFLITKSRVDMYLTVESLDYIIFRLGEYKRTGSVFPAELISANNDTEIFLRSFGKSF